MMRRRSTRALAPDGECRRRSRVLPILTLALAAAPLVAADADRFAGRLEPCELPGLEAEARCGRLEVAEDRSRPAGRRIELRVVVLPATGPEPAADAVTFLAGGGVAPATRFARLFARLEDLRRERDVVLVDQRGTGGSNPLDCPPQEDGEGLEAHLERCLAGLAERADPRFYTTVEAVADLEAVRGWLGYPRWTLWGVSYGTKVARVFLRTHPERVRAVLLHGVVPLAFSMWPDLWASGQEALVRLFDRCAADVEGCGAAYPDPASQLVALLHRLDRDPVTVEVEPPGGGEAVAVTVDRTAVTAAIGGALRSHDLARRIPGWIDAAAKGDLAPFARPELPGPPPVPVGVYLSIACTEELPRLAEVRPRQPAVRPFHDGGGWLDRQLRSCEVWPAGELPAGFTDPVTSDVPVLLLTGAEDFVTPPAYAERVAATLARARHIVVPARSHDDFDPCLGEIAQQFVAAGDAEHLDLACLEAEPPGLGLPPAGP